MKNAVITGASSGLGEFLYNKFGEQYDVLGGAMDTTDPTDDGLFHLDLRQTVSIAQFVMQARQKMDQVDLLINCAGMNDIRSFEEITPEFLNEVMWTNCFGPVMLTQFLLPYLRKGAVVINIISDAAWRPMRHSLAYNCSKAAFDMATKQLARELTKPRGISIIGIRPGKMAETGMSNYIDQRVCEVRGWTMKQAREYFKANSVTGLETPPEAVADFIYSILDNGMAPYMSGACVDLVG